jgi:hypothetical protein
MAASTTIARKTWEQASPRPQVCHLNLITLATPSCLTVLFIRPRTAGELYVSTRLRYPSHDA